MRILSYLLFIPFLLFSTQIFAQIPPPCPTPPPPGAESCQATCVYCNFDGYMGTNNGTPSGGQQVCGQISLHNDEWFGFIAGSTDISIDISTSNCDDGNGLQAAFFDACAAEALNCNPGSAGGEGQPLPLSYSGFVEGQVYYLMIDGWSGDVCDYSINVTGGSVTPPPVDPVPPIQGCTNVCPGAECVYTIPAVFGAGNYLWTAPPGSMINGAGSTLNIPANQGGTSVTIVFGNAGGQVCVTASNQCSPAQKQCINVVNVPVPVTNLAPFTICSNELPWQWPEEPFPVLVAPGVYNLTSTPYDNYLGCDSVIKQKITVKAIPSTTLGTFFICDGDCYTYNSQQYCTGGSYEVNFTTPSGCDSIVRFNLIQAPVAAAISPTNPIIDCLNPSVQLSNQGSAGNQFLWYNSNWQLLGNGPTYTATTTGVFHLIVANNVGNISCRDTATVTVGANGAVPTADATAGSISCAIPTVSLAGSSNLPTAAYLWSGPGIIFQNQNQQNPMVSVGGTYFLTVTNPANGCTAMDSVVVASNQTPPIASATGGTLTCAQTNFQINLTSNVNPVNVVWTGAGINGSNQNQQNPTVGQPDTYTAVITNPANGCTSTAAATVNQNTTIPQATATGATLTCANPSATISGSTNYTGGIVCGWNFPNGQVFTTPQIQVTQPGQYVFFVTDNSTGCSNAISVVVDADFVPPTVNAGVNKILNCNDPSAVLNGSGSTGANFTVNWTGPGINASNQNLLNPTVSLSGNYTLTILNQDNGCTASDQATVSLDIATPTVSAGSDQFISCTTQGGVTLNGAGSPAGIQFLWTGPGIGANNETQANPTVTQPGNYQVVVTNPTNGCTATDQVVVTKDANIPDAIAGIDQTINCAVNSVNLSGAGSSSGATIVYSWTGPGSFTSLDLNPTNITVPGNYVLTVLNTLNNCQNTDVQTVILDKNQPTVVTSGNIVLNCFNNSSDTLGIGTSSSGANFEITWSGAGITPANQNSPSPIVSQAGIYTLTILNTENQCVGTATATATADLAPPVAAAGLDKLIDCITTAVQIGGATTSTGADFTYLWTGAGISAANQNQKNPIVDKIGNYQLVVTDKSNGCTATDQMDLTSNAVVPTADAGVPATLTCLVPTAGIGSTATSTGADIQIQWDGPGITAFNFNQQEPQINLPGIYILTVLNSSNSCQAADTVEIFEQKDLPIAHAGDGQTIDCQKVTVVLDGSLSASGANFSYLWTGAGINASNQNEQSPTVNQPGVYYLEVTDNSNGCTATAEVSIGEDVTPPEAFAESPLVLTCSQPALPIDANSSSTGADFGYIWTGPGINTLNQNHQNPVVTEQGVYTLTVLSLINNCTATITATVEFDKAIPDADAGQPITLTCKNDTIRLDGGLSAVGSQISYSWTGPGIVSGDEDEMFPQVFQPGVYSLVVSDAWNGCTNLAATTAIENKLSPAAEANLDLFITCAVNSVQLSSAGSATGANIVYFWTGAGISPADQNLPNPTVSLAGQYDLLVVDTANGCSATDFMKVDLDKNIPTVNAGVDQLLTCKITDVQLPATATNPSAGSLIFEWIGAGISASNKNDEQPTVSQSGTYTLVVTNSTTNCSATDVIVVNENKVVPQVQTTADKITCTDPTATFSTTTNAAQAQFLWEGPAMSNANKVKQNPVVTEPGLYTLTVTDGANGCSATIQFTVEQDADFPVGTAEGGLLNCKNDGVDTLAASVSTVGATFSWTGPGGFSSLDLNPTVSTGGTYFFRITSANGCTKTVQVFVASDFAKPTAKATASEQIDCNTPEVGIDGSGSSVGSDFQYEWAGANILAGANSLNPTVGTAGDYQLLITNLDNGCTAETTVLVENDPEVPTAFDLDLQDIKCFGETNGSFAAKVVGGTAPFSFVLDGKLASPTGSFQKLAAGQYLLEMTDANGCELDSLITISEPSELLVELGEDVLIELGDSTRVLAEISSSTPLASIKWTPAAPCDSSDCTEFWAKPFNTILYEIQLVDENGCRTTDQKLVRVERGRRIFVPNIFDPNSSENNSIFIQASSRNIKNIRSFLIFDRWGEAVFEVRGFQPNDPTKAWDGRVKGKQGAAAVYVWYAEVEFIDGEVVIFKGDVAKL